MISQASLVGHSDAVLVHLDSWLMCIDKWITNDN
jgi:hypothetical protein